MFLPQLYRRLKRGPQVILPKDIGMVIAYTGVGRDSVCVDAGTGSGWLAVSLARICKHVTSYDIRPEFLTIAEKNMKMLGLENLVLKEGDVKKGVEERDADLFTLDMPDSDKAVGSAHASLRPGGHIFGYLPHAEQVQKFARELERHKFRNILIMEVIARDMLAREEGFRPSTKGVWHTGYLAFAQK